MSLQFLGMNRFLNLWRSAACSLAGVFTLAMIPSFLFAPSASALNHYVMGGFAAKTSTTCGVDVNGRTLYIYKASAWIQHPGMELLSKEKYYLDARMSEEVAAMSYLMKKDNAPEVDSNEVWENLSPVTFPISPTTYETWYVASICR